MKLGVCLPHGFELGVPAGLDRPAAGSIRAGLPGGFGVAPVGMKPQATSPARVGRTVERAAECCSIQLSGRPVMHYPQDPVFSPEFPVLSWRRDEAWAARIASTTRPCCPKTCVHSFPI